ncbi:MAG: hypothetical protein V3T86_14325 [Planctomycetota bacterium]
MRRTGWSTCVLACAMMAIVLVPGCTGESVDPALSNPDLQAASIFFLTTTVPDGGAGQLYDTVIFFGTTGLAPLPDRFEVDQGVLPDGVQLLPEMGGNGEPTGNAVLVGFPRREGNFLFKVRAVTTSTDPALAATQPYGIEVDDGQIAILTPTAEEGTIDVAVPAFPDVIDFVNPANAQAFFSFKFQTAGGSGINRVNVYMPRELELSSFDATATSPTEDTDESATSKSKYEVDFNDGGWFTSPAGASVQVGGFQSPRGPVGTVDPLDTDWFQATVGAGPPQNSRRFIGDMDHSVGPNGADTLLIPGRSLFFSDYFDSRYIDTQKPDVPGTERRKYPFSLDEYANMFFLSETSITSLRYYIIVEAIDTNGTDGVAFRGDDFIDRKAFIVQVKIPDIRIDTIFLPDGQAGLDYNEFVAASGGVAPLFYELEYADAVEDFAVTIAGAGELDIAFTGLGMERTTGMIIGVPRVSAFDHAAPPDSHTEGHLVELSFRVFADVMNPAQGGGLPYDATANQGEYQGIHPDFPGKATEDKNGIHRTYQVRFELPTAPMVLNTGLPPGLDGTGYPAGTFIAGVGGVPFLVPDPVGFTGIYPTGNGIRRAYEWSSTYGQDDSPDFAPTPDPAAPGLPNFLTLDGDKTSATNGQISGNTMDRGFHSIEFTQTDVYNGEARSPSVANNQGGKTTLVLSVSPDDTVFFRGVYASEGGGGQTTGLEDATNQQNNARNVPIALAGSIFSIRTGETPALYSGIDAHDWDILPVMLAHGGDSVQAGKAYPSINGFWPSESGKENDFNYNTESPAWGHHQQEMTWIQTNLEDHNRVFLWAQTNIQKWNSSQTNGPDSHRYQEYQSNGDRGILVVNPATGDFWVPAVLDYSGDHGHQFGAEGVLSHDSSGPSPSTDGLTYAIVAGSGSRITDSRSLRDYMTQGLGAYIESHTRTSSSPVWAWATRAYMGRGATTVAASADGVWGATVMRGGDGPRLLLWRNDKESIDGTLAGSSAVGERIDGLDSEGNATLTDSALIFELEGVNASGVSMSNSHMDLLPDSLLFVEDGLIFLMGDRLDKVFGLNLISGEFTSLEVPAANSFDGQAVPDQDHLRLALAQASFNNQYAFCFNKPADGEEGPNRIGFAAGDMRGKTRFTDLSGAGRTNNFGGWGVESNNHRRVYFLEVGMAGGLDLSDAGILTDLTLGNTTVGGDILTPGRLGEKVDYMAMSPDGETMAVGREYSVSQNFNGTYFTYSVGTSTSTNWQANHDIMLFSTDPGEDLDDDGNNILFFGTNSATNGASLGGLPGNAEGAAHLNARHRRISGVTFGSNTGAGERSMIFTYSGNSQAGRNPLYNGRNGPGWALNPDTSQSSSFHFGFEMHVRVQYLNDDEEKLVFQSEDEYMFNMLEDVGDADNSNAIAQIGPTNPPFSTTASSQQMFWVTFKSQNEDYLYYVSDQLNGRNYLVGYNISGGDLDHDQYVPFLPHADRVGFEQIDVQAFNYTSRFYAVPALNPDRIVTGRDGAGLVFFIASASSAGPTSASDLELYVFDANVGGEAHVLSSDITDGSSNALNHIYCSLDGNVVAAQRAKVGGSSQNSRTTLNSRTDLFAISNVHGVVENGDVPNAFIISSDDSHGASIAFVGDGSAAGPQAVVFSRVNNSSDSGNRSWDNRELMVALLAPGATAATLDSTQSHYVVLAAGRATNDNATTQD